MHDIVIGTVVSNKNEDTTDKSVENTWTKNNDENAKKSAPVRKGHRARSPVVRLNYGGRGVIYQQE